MGTCTDVGHYMACKDKICGSKFNKMYIFTFLALSATL